MWTIESYQFGCMSVNGTEYKKDVILLPDHVQSPWWRDSGHLLQLKDLQYFLGRVKPKALVVGTGKFGVMRLAQDILRYAEENGIELTALPTQRAVDAFHEVQRSESPVMGAFHLTC